jgi:chromosome segregation ATPase
MTEHEKEAAKMGDMEVLDDRQRVDRWLEEGRYLLGRTIPALLDDRDRLRGKLEAAEQDCERLRLEINELRREAVRLQNELDQFRSAQVAIGEAFGNVMDLIGQLNAPLSDINKRLQSSRFEAAETAE